MPAEPDRDRPRLPARPGPSRAGPAARAVRSRDPSSPVGRGVVALLPVVVAACGWGGDELPRLRCAAFDPPSSEPATVADTLELVVALPTRGEPFELLVRVDPLDEDGVVAFPEDVPPAAAAAGATLTSAARFTVCLSPGPAAVVFEGTATPHDRAWVRVSTDRPVRAVVRIGGESGSTLSPPLDVAPGASGRRSWSTAGEGR